MKIKLQLLVLALLISIPAFSQKKKVALTSFSSNRTVGIEKITMKHKFLVSVLKQLPSNPDFQLTSTLNNYHDKFVYEYAKKLDFEILPVEEITESKDYITLTPKNAMDEGDEMEIVSADGYKYFRTDLFTKGNRNRLATFIKNKSDGYMTVNTNFEFVETRVLMVKYINILATTEIRLFNGQGKRIFTIREGAKSNKNILKLAEIPMISPDNVLSLCDDALQELIKDLDNRVEAINRKARKKL